MKWCYRKVRSYKYQLIGDFEVETNIVPPEGPIDTEYIKLSDVGLLWIKDGYQYDGASGPTLDTPSSMRGSLVHDAFYQLIRMKLLPMSYRIKADAALRKICKEDKMWKWRACAWEKILKIFGQAAAMPEPMLEKYCLDIPLK